MKNLKLYLYGAVIVIFISAIVTTNILIRKNKILKAEVERVQTNYRIAQDSVKLILGKDSINASRLEAQQLTINELKSYYSSLVDDVKDMKIQLRKVTGITSFATETTNNINTFFKDSVRVDSVHIQTLSYSDKWIDLQIVKEGLETLITTKTRDSLIQVVHWDRTGKFWPTKFLTKKVFYQDIKSMNPNSKITYAKWITPIKN